MKVTQEKLPDSQIGLEIEVSPEMSKKTYDKVVGQLVKSVNIPGFRRGKVPRQVVLQRFGTERINASVLEELVQTAIDQAIKQEDITAIGNYQLQSSFEELMGQFKPGAELTIAASVDVPPSPTLKTYTGLTVQVEEVTYDESRVAETLEDYRNRMATLVPVEDRAAQLGDAAIVDFEGLIQPEAGSDDEPQPFAGNTAQDFQVDLEEGRFIPGFIDGIVGMKPEETKEVAVTFPDDYAEASLAGKPVVFTITVKELKTKELPELDDDFAQEVSNDEFETLEALKANLEERFRDEVEQKLKQNKEQAILDELVKHLEIELPKTLITQESNHMISQTAVRLSQQGIDVNKLLTEEMIERMRAESRPEAVNRLKRTLALGEVAKQENITVSDDELKAKVAEMLQDVSPEERRSLDMDRLNSVVQEDLLKDKLLSWLEENWTIELVPEGSLSAADEDESEDATAVDVEVVDEAESEKG